MERKFSKPAPGSRDPPLHWYNRLPKEAVICIAVLHLKYQENIRTPGTIAAPGGIAIDEGEGGVPKTPGVDLRNALLYIIYRVFFFTGPPLKFSKYKIMLEYPNQASQKS